MRAFIITSFCFAAFGGLCRLGNLSWSDYPRVVKWTRGEDSFGVVASIAWCVWAAWLLWA